MAKRRKPAKRGTKVFFPSTKTWVTFKKKK